MSNSAHPFAVVSLALLAFSELSLADEGCPRTMGANEVFAEPWSQADAWYGAESLAVVLPADGQWTTTRSPALISVKLFWYSVGYQPGMERDFVGRIRRLDDGPNMEAIITIRRLSSETFWTNLRSLEP